jgi:hypothetical protein
VTSFALYCLSGNVIGVRRAQPLVIVLGIFACLFLRTLLASTSRVLRSSAYLAFGIWMATSIYQWQNVRAGLGAAQIALPRDFDFLIPPGQTMATTIAHLLDGSVRLPEDLTGYEPDRTLCILYVLSLPKPLYTPDQIIARCDLHGWSIPSNAPRLMRVRSGVKKLYRLLFGQRSPQGAGGITPHYHIIVS